MPKTNKISDTNAPLPQQRQISPIEWLVNRYMINNNHLLLIDIAEAEKMFQAYIIKAVNDGMSEGVGLYLDTDKGEDNEFTAEEYFRKNFEQTPINTGK